ncbi:hypothetical protein GCM10023149_04490 [Mucilaginibacter gynuensis]|uniref:DUF3606 domain-containing protein n=1 Tax=Mucilaginibacter gynuensis TaxID=1302236 RepID=A0ABP8FS88_9SPHI
MEERRYHTATTDRNIINLNRNEDVEYWTNRFNTTRVKLKAALNAVGSEVENVEAWLRNR